MLEYRIRRLPAARRIAASKGCRGARFPWESAEDGDEATPPWVPDGHGNRIRVHTAEVADHISADIAWAAIRYASWTGDDDFLGGPGAPLVVDAARFFASRARFDGNGAHLYGVIGPDEYHEVVDDNAYTNVMARWTLRRAAELAGGRRRKAAAVPVAAVPVAAVPVAERRRWLEIAEALVDGYVPSTGLYEQFAGFWGLEPLIVTDVTEVPVAADLLLGRERVARSQVLKQPDALMLHLLVEDEVQPGSLEPNLDFYGPRTAHGSSLSPPVQAALLARAGRPDEALEVFRMAARLDFDDLTGTTAGGLHLATMGGLWQALVHGFLGLRFTPDGVTLHPHLPRGWRSVEVMARLRDQRVCLHADASGAGGVEVIDAAVSSRPPRLRREA